MDQNNWVIYASASIFRIMERLIYTKKAFPPMLFQVRDSPSRSKVGSVDSAAMFGAADDFVL